jgi:hypothetical protein
MLTFRLRRNDEGGVVGANLAIVLAFALYAVIQLSRTTLAAQQIDTRVKDINKEVVPINSDLNNVPKLDQTTADAAAILQAAKPLSGQADQIINTAKSIDGHVSDILGNASTINGTVHSINGTALDIGATVNSIHSTATNLAPVVNQIHDGVVAINNKADVALGTVTGIAGDLHSVLGQVGTSIGPNSILTHANAIDCNTVLAALSGPGCNRTFA